jgi:hypothetical protein
MKTTIKIKGGVLPQTIFSDPVLSRTFKGNTKPINTCIFNPNMYSKLLLIFIIFIGNKQ